MEVQENWQQVKTFFYKLHHFYDDSHNEKDCSDNKGHFLELLDVVASNSKDLKLTGSQVYGHYSSPESQNDMISIIGDKLKQIKIPEVKEAQFLKF